MQASEKTGYTRYQPEPKSTCLCGSGAQYQRCCKSRLPGFAKAGRWKKAAAAKRWTEMIRHLRADVTQYTIWHRSLTAPAVARQPELRGAWLMNIDIEALSDYVESLMWGYARKGWLKRLPATLNRLKGNIDDPRWLAKIAYQRAICALWSGDREQAKQEIEHLQPIEPGCGDVDLLQVQLDLHGTTMGMTRKLSFFDGICSRSNSRPDKLQYGGARAFEILLAEDEEGARAAFDTVISLGREMEEESAFSGSAEIWFCKALEGRAVIAQDVELFAEIDLRFRRMLEKHGEWSKVGLAHLWRARGDAQRYAGNYASARDSYRAVRELVTDPEIDTLEAECALGLGDPVDAFRLIDGVAVDKLDEPQRADHAFTYFYVALSRGDRKSLLHARELLKNAVTPKPYFQNRRQKYIITVGEALEAIANREELPKLGPILATLKKVSRYVQIQPNWNGLGLNGNAIIDDYLERAEDKLKRDAKDTPTFPKS